MELCSDGHAEVVHDQGWSCPVCELVVERNEAHEQAETARDDLNALQEQHDELEEQVADLEARVAEYAEQVTQLEADVATLVRR